MLSLAMRAATYAGSFSLVHKGACPSVRALKAARKAVASSSLRSCDRWVTTRR